MKYLDYINKNKKYVKKIMSNLLADNERMVKIINERIEGKNLKEIGEMLGVTRERIGQIEAKAWRRACVLSKRIDVDNNSFDDFDILYKYLPRRVVIALKKAGISSIQELRWFKEAGQLEEIRNIGKKSKKKVNDFIDKWSVFEARQILKGSENNE